MTRIAKHADMGPRENLEDATAAIIIPAGMPHASDVTVLLTCDGVGGNNHGEVASATAIQRIIGFLASFFAVALAADKAAALTRERITAAMIEALGIANAAILELIAKDTKLTGMATTVVCGLVHDGVLHVAWAGDSRCYLYHCGRVHQLTTDHSEVQALLKEHLISEEEARNHPLSHTIWNYLGKSNFWPSVIDHPLPVGDVIVLCTDGLTDVLDDADIAQTIAASRASPSGVGFGELPNALVTQALRFGAQDNVTVLCCEYGVESPSTPAFERTATDSYRLELAKTMEHFLKEHGNVRDSSSPANS